MLGNFLLYKPTKLYFGNFSLLKLRKEMQGLGEKVLLIYGGGSIKKNGIYDKVTAVLQKGGKQIVEDSGVMANPTAQKLRDGARLAREAEADWILAVGGGSVCDYAKAVSVSAWCDEDPYEKYFIHREAPEGRILPVGCILTMAGTGSEMNSISVISDPQQGLKIAREFPAEIAPRFSLLNPEFTYSVPKRQMSSGVFDILSHLMEQYFSGNDDCASDYILEGMMRSLIHSSRIAVQNPKDYPARSNIMWLAALAMSSIPGMGKEGDWQVHMMGHAVSALTDAPHGMTLSALSLPYYRYILSDGKEKLARFAENVWNVSDAGTEEKQAASGLDALRAWMREMELPMHLGELGVTEEMLPQIVDHVILLKSGYHALSREEVRMILQESL